jgi:3-phosphoshikimate 1-carboxyvinyltransferase
MDDASDLRIRCSSRLRGTVALPGDKSLSHRALLLAALAEGPSRIGNCLTAGVTDAMIDCLRELGARIEVQGFATALPAGAGEVAIRGKGLRGFAQPTRPLDCRGSATTMRLLAGVLAGQPFPSTLDGNDRLRERPMDRVVEPLTEKGARISSNRGCAPLLFSPSSLIPSSHSLSVASAQVKSALLLAGLFCKGTTEVSEPHTSRDHTERMLRQLGVEIEERIDPEGRHVVVMHDGVPSLPPFEVDLLSDPSSAAFLLVAGALVPGSEIEIPQVCVNPGRIGLIQVLGEMGASLRIDPSQNLVGSEPAADLHVRSGDLSAVTVEGSVVTSMIDEFPIFAVAATQAGGATVVKDAGELRVKESDRIQALCEELSKLGARIEPKPDGFVVHGPVQLKGATVSGRGDHRLAMSLAVAGLVADGETVVEGWRVIEDSFPGFPDLLKGLGADVSW